MNSITIENVTIAIVRSGTTVKAGRMSFRYEKCAIVAKLGTEAATRIQTTKNQVVIFEWAAYPYDSVNGRGAETKADAEAALKALAEVMKRKTWKGIADAVKASDAYAITSAPYMLHHLAPAIRKGSLK